MVYITVNSEDTVISSSTVLPTPISTKIPPIGHSCATPEDAAIIYVVDNTPSAIITSITNGTNGLCDATGNATVMYTPNAGFSGTDECEYELCIDSLCNFGVLTITVIEGSADDETKTTSSVSAETSSTIPAGTSSPIVAETTSTEVPSTVIIHEFNHAPELPLASYMCPDIDSSNVTGNILPYKYQVVIDQGADINAAMQVIEMEINDHLVSQMRCSQSGMRRKLLIAGLVGADSNPADSVSAAECKSDAGQCVVIDGGLTVYGDVDIEEVQSYVGSVMPDIVSSVNASVVESRLMTSSATLDSSDAMAEGGSSNITTIAIAGAAIVAVLGAALLVGKRRSSQEFTEESEAVLRNEFPQKSVPREIPHGMSNDSATLLTETSFESKQRKSLKSVFRSTKHNGESLPSSPAFSVSSSKSKSYDIEDTVDL
jgi:hypothetical protein